MFQLDVYIITMKSMDDYKKCVRGCLVEMFQRIKILVGKLDYPVLYNYLAWHAYESLVVVRNRMHIQAKEKIKLLYDQGYTDRELQLYQLGLTDAMDVLGEGSDYFLRQKGKIGSLLKK